MLDFLLPRLMLVTDSGAMRGDFAFCLGEALCGAAQADTRVIVQIREKEMAPRELLRSLHNANELAHRERAVFLLNGGTLPQEQSDARKLLQLCDGVHWPERFLENEHREYSHAKLNGISVHSQEAAKRASTRGFDYAVFGAIFQTATHPGAAGVGTKTLKGICAQTDLPLFAIGGIDVQNAPRVLASGAYGIAVKSAIWNAENIGDATRELCGIARGDASLET